MANTGMFASVGSMMMRKCMCMSMRMLPYALKYDSSCQIT